VKELSRRVLRCSFWCIIVGFSQLLADDLQKQQLLTIDSQKAFKDGVLKQEFKAPRVDGDGNVYAAVPIPNPAVASVVASVIQVQTEVGVIKTDVVKVNTRLVETDSKIDTGFFTLNSKLDSLLVDTETLQISLDLVSDDVLTVGSKLDIYNGTLNNKLDTILVDAENLQISLDDVSDNVLTVGSKLDACCFTSNSKIDLLIDSALIVQSILDNLNVVVDVTELESKLDACCLTINNKLDTIFEDAQSILDNLNVAVDMATLESKLDACCFTTNGKLDLLIGDVSVVESLMIEGGACEPTSLSSSDVVGGIIVLAVPGNYCLAQDLGLSGALTVSLAAQNITLCLNNRELRGHIEVYGALAQIKDGTLSVPAAMTGVMVAATASLTSISHVKVLCDSDSAGTALELRAQGCVILDSFCAGGGTGGDGISLYASDALVHNSEATAYTLGGGHCIACYAPASKNSFKLCRCDGRDELVLPGFGCGMYIAAGCSSIEIRDCTIARTASFAIEDNHVGQSSISLYSSVMYNNFAYDSANSSATYQIRNKKSMGQSYGVDLVSGSPGLYANVYIP
jgi:hypothetical protein